MFSLTLSVYLSLSQSLSLGRSCDIITFPSLSVSLSRSLVLVGCQLFFATLRRRLSARVPAGMSGCLRESGVYLT